MPFLKPFRLAPSKIRMETCKRNGWRSAIYKPTSNEYSEELYRGQWRNDKREGKGTELKKHGWMYEGDWLNDRKHGHGVLSKVSLDSTIHKCYEGEWVKGRKHGTGCSWYEDGSYYDGTFWRDKRHGYGRMWHIDGSYYQGTWRNDCYHGSGILVQANGNRYEGQFIRGKKEGEGKFFHLNTGQMQSGYWENDVCIHSTLEDIYWRQSALRPTAYPIPKLKSSDWRNHHCSSNSQKCIDCNVHALS